MPFPNPLFRYPIRFSETAYVLVVEADGSAEDLDFPASGTLDPVTNYFFSGDGGPTDLLGMLGDTLATHTDILTCDVEFDADFKLDFDPSGPLADLQLIWSHVNTTLDAVTFGFIDGEDSEINPTVQSPNVPLGIVRMQQLPKIDSRPRQPIVGGISMSISGLTRASRLALPRRRRRLEFSLMPQALALDEYAPADAPWMTCETLYRDALSLGRPVHYVPDELEPLEYSVLRLAPPLVDNLVRDDQYLLLWHDVWDFIIDEEVEPPGLPEYQFAPIDVGGVEMYIAAAPLAHMWIESDQTRDACANTRVSAAGNAVGRIDDPVNGHIVWNEGADTLRPLYRTTGAHAHFEFDGTDDRLQVMNSLGTSTLSPFAYYHTTGIGSVLMRAGVRNNGTARTLLTMMATSNAGVGLLVELNASNQLVVLVRATGVVVFSYTSTATLTAAMGIVPIELRFNNAGGGDLRINGGTLETFARTNAPGSGSPSSDFFIGARSGGTQPTQLDLADLLLSSSYVSDADIALWRGLGLASFPATFTRQIGLPEAAGAPWFNNLRRWHDFQDQTRMWTDAMITNVAANNDPIQVIGHAGDAVTQHLNRTLTSTTTQRPLYQTDDAGALFDGTNDNLTAPILDDDGLGGAKTIVLIVQTLEVAATVDVLVQGFNGSNSAQLCIDTAAVQDNVEWFDNGVATGVAAAPITPLGTWHIVAFTRDAAGAWTARTPGGTVVSVTNVRGFTFRSLGVNGATTLNGRFVEYLAWNIAMTDDELEVVFDGLRDRHQGLGL